MATTQLREGQFKSHTLTAADIADGTILDAEINSAAAIAHTKLNISFKPPVATFANLPASSNPGDMIVVQATGLVYVWTTAWHNITDFTGLSLTIGSLAVTSLTVNSNHVPAVTSNTTFPSSPAAGDLSYRTDLDFWFIYNGTVWAQI
jgi:hypothetical protein